jgi:hypothetical protein
VSSALRQIFASFGVEFDTEKLEHGNHKVEESKKKLRELGEVVIEAFAVEKVFEFTHELIEQADALDHAAVATGLSTDELQAWQLGAAEADVDAQAFSISLRRLSSALAGGADESGSASKIFSKLGIATKDSAGHTLGLGEVLQKVSDHFAEMPDGAAKAALATELFGRQGTQLIPLLNKGAEGIGELRAELEDLGGGFSPEFIKNASAVDEEGKRLTQAWTSLKVKIAGYILPAFDSVVRALTKLASWAGKVAQQTNVVTAVLVAFGVKGAAALLSLAVANAPLLAEFGLMALGIGLVVLAIDELITTWQGGDTLITRAIDKIFGAGSTAKAVAWIKSVGNGISEMFGAASNDSEGFHLAWQKSLADIQGDTEGFGGYWRGFLAGAEDLFFATVNAFSNGWSGFGDFMSGILDGLLFNFQVVWDNIKYAGLGVAAALSDAFDAFLAHLGPIKDLAKKLGVDLSSGGGHAGEDLAADEAKNTRDRVAQAQDIDDRIRGNGKYRPKPRAPGADAGGEGGTNVTVHAPVNVTVPAGTPGHVAQHVARAAAKGAAGAHRAAANAIAPNGGDR